jgi:hypothetical protein
VDKVGRWLQAYVGAWKSYDRDQIGELFAEDVRYRYHPHDDPVVQLCLWLRRPPHGHKNGHQPLRHRPYQSVRRGCHIHAVRTT